MTQTRQGQESDKKSIDTDIEEQKQIITSFFGTIKRYFRKWGDIFSGVTDHR